ncbi:hypothetical protein GCM10027161_51660 [Microbispora hainanensis]
MAVRHGLRHDGAPAEQEHQAETPGYDTAEDPPGSPPRSAVLFGLVRTTRFVRTAGRGPRTRLGRLLGELPGRLLLPRLPAGLGVRARWPALWRLTGRRLVRRLVELTQTMLTRTIRPGAVGIGGRPARI